MAQDVLFIKMAQDSWLLKEDGYLNADTDLKKVVYHPTLNVILICTRSGSVKVLDVNSGVVLQSTYLSAVDKENISCHYINGQDRILFSDGYSVGVRSDYNGVLLLDTILQRPITNIRDTVKIELLLSEAMILYQSLQNVNTPAIDAVLVELTEKIQEARSQSKKGVKAQKWNTVCLELKVESLKVAVERALTDLFLGNRHSPELGVVSAVQDRLTDLVGEQVSASDKKAMASEAKRRETFTHWPHMDYKWALPDQMAQAGFYHQPNASGDDRAMCFTCTVCLVCWERTDEPWSEHERHSPTCPFVLGEYTQNVPLSVTHATNPALDATFRGVSVNIIGTSSVANLVTTANSDGLISVFDIAGKVARTHSFYITQYDSHILEKLTQDFGVPSIWTPTSEEDKYPMERKITALTIVGEKSTCRATQSIQPTPSIRPTIICGLLMQYKDLKSFACSNVDAMNDQNSRSNSSSMNNMDVDSQDEASQTQSSNYSSCLYLVVYDFLYNKKYGLDVDVKNDEKTIAETTKRDLEMMEYIDIISKYQDSDQFSVLPNGNVTNLDLDKTQFLFPNMLPGQSDEIFLQTLMQTPKVSGPRVLPKELLNAETEASQGSSLIISSDYSFMNGQVNMMNETCPGKSISDHISDLKNSKSYNKLSYSRAVQCISLPNVYKRRSDLQIAYLQPTLDGTHLVVVLNSKLPDRRGVLLLYHLDFATDDMIRIGNNGEPLQLRELTGGERILELNMLGAATTTSAPGGATVADTVATSNSTLVQQAAAVVAPSVAAEGMLVVVCADGVVRIIEAATLKVVSMAMLENERFVSAVYCNSLERLCASTEKGSLHFYAVNDMDNDSTEDHDEDDLFAMNADILSTSYSNNNSNSINPTVSPIPTATNAPMETTTTTDSAPSIQATPECSNTVVPRAFQEPAVAIPILELRRLQALTAFEPYKQGYNPVVPICWSEIQQAQRLRRHPQHLQKENEQITKTWRLQTDTTTWDEHIFELTLPAPICVGHVDLNFRLHTSSAPPCVQITLLKQNTANIGHRRDVKFSAVDDSVTFDQLQTIDNPVTSHEYLRAHNAEILAGPIPIAQCLDLTEVAGCVTLTSPKLFKSRNRTLLLHMKEVRSKTDSGAASGSNAKGTPRPKRSTGSITSDYMGCDCLHEVSVTVYGSKPSNSTPSAPVGGTIGACTAGNTGDAQTTGSAPLLPQQQQHMERTQRIAMLESNVVVQALLLSAIGDDSADIGDGHQHYSKRCIYASALDILTWIANIRLCRNRSYMGETPAQQVQFLKAIGRDEIERLIRRRLLLADRSIAHKCMKFIVTCCDGAKNISTSVQISFESMLSSVLLTLLEDVEMVKSAGGLQWFAALLYKITKPEQVKQLSTKCIKLLTHLACELKARTNPYHLILRSRFGLYGTPLEPELFDIDPPPLIKGTSQNLTYSSVVAGDGLIPPADFHTTYGFNKEYLDPKEVLMSRNAVLKEIYSWTSKLFRGLLETEPLHFTCVAASDGTRVERADLGGATISVVPPVNVPPPPVSLQTTGTKKLVETLDATMGNNNDDPHLNSVFQSDFYDMMMEKQNTKNENSNKICLLYPMGIAHKQLISSLIPKHIKTPTVIVGSQTPIITTTTSKQAINVKTPSLNQVEQILSPSKSLPWQQLLISPTQQVIVVERMHSGARRYVTLDFGQPVLLTDLFIPLCTELLSISVDVWLDSEEVDVMRLAIAQDISLKNLVLNDLQPAPLCRYVKITTIGRFGMSTTRCRIPTGFFYGHLIVLPDDIPPDSTCAATTALCAGPVQLESQLRMLTMLFEDVTCRYSIACSKLKNLLHPFLVSDTTSAAHLSAYMNMMRDKSNVSMENMRIFNAYQEAITYQQQHNMVRHVMSRIEYALKSMKNEPTEQQAPSTGDNDTVVSACTDKLYTIAETILELLFTVDFTAGIDIDTCRTLFQGFCITQRSRVQFLSATLLHRACHTEPFWGAFLADTLCEMFSSSYMETFPQDRVFVLLVYLVKRCTGYSAKLDASLRVVAQTLAPLAARSNRNSLLGVTVDLQLLGWLLLYVSLQLDVYSPAAAAQCAGAAPGNNRQTGSRASVGRWDWIPGEMASRTADASVGGNVSSFRLKGSKIGHRIFKKKPDYALGHVVDNTTQALSALSSHAQNLTEKLEQALSRQTDTLIMKIKNIQKKDGNTKAPPIDHPLTATTSQQQQQQQHKQVGKRRREIIEVITERSGSPEQPQQAIDNVHCRVIIRGLLGILLSVDHSSSCDMFVLSCKVIARLMRMSALPLSQAMTKEQLLKLIELCISTELPFATHALACLIQEILDVTRTVSSDENIMETDIQPPSTSWSTNEFLHEADNFCEFPVDEAQFHKENPKFKAASSSSSNNNSNNANNNVKNNNEAMQILYESDDSEIDDILEEIFERGRIVLNKSSKAFYSSFGDSTAMDQRLECSVEEQTEITLRRLLSTSSSALVQNISTPPPKEDVKHELPDWPASLTSTWQNVAYAHASNKQMLMSCFDALCKDLQSQSTTFIAQVLQLWLTLNCPNAEEKFNSSQVPYIGLGIDSIVSLIEMMSWCSNLPLRMWCCVLQTLTLVCNIRKNDGGGTPDAPDDDYDTFRIVDSRETSAIINHPSFVNMMLKLLSGTGIIHCEKGLVGPALCKAMHDFLVRLQIRSDALNINSAAGNHFKGLLLKILLDLIGTNGPIACRQGPLDAQCKFLHMLLNLNYQNSNLNIAVDIFDCASNLILSSLTNPGRIKCINIGDNANPNTNTFSGIFSSIIGNEMCKQDKPASWASFLISLMKLLQKLVKTPLPTNGNEDETMETETNEMSQTDESKAEQIQQDANIRLPNNVPCLADTVLGHHFSVVALCKALATCKASSLSMLANLSPQNMMDIGEPGTVYDSVFSILSTLARRATNKELILAPILLFLNCAPQLSEPFLWFILQVLDTAEALEVFLEMGGISTLGSSLVRSNKSASTISTMGNISMVMHHFLGQHVKSDPLIPSSKKHQQQANMETTMSLINFAPYGSIKCPSTTSNQAELLIQGNQATHRRARAPQWSYHFYPEELHTELTLQLPSAILLREVQIQPHLGHLATCPSGVALEVSADGPSRLVPACPPLPTSGMTCIRLYLPVPEVVNCVQLRLYKPRDATNIGLSQIRLLGTSAFGSLAKQQVLDLSDDENHCKHSLGWLRLLHHCFALARNTSFEEQVIADAAAVPDLLTSCCSLLLVPTHIPSLYLPNLEKVLCDLSLFNRENGLKAIEVLLNSRPYIAESNIIVNLGSGRHLINSPNAQTACELLCQICGHQDTDTQYRLALILDWLSNMSTTAVQGTSPEPCNPAYICSIASIIWDATENPITYECLRDMVTYALFERLYTFCSSITRNASLKYALDSLLCSLCYVRMDFYPQLLQNIGVLATVDVANVAASSITVAESMTDDGKRRWCQHFVIRDVAELYLTGEQLETIAAVSRSPTAIKQLLDSGLPMLLNEVILILCASQDGATNTGRTSPMADQVNVANILKFFSHVCEERTMRDWFGTADGSVFWLPLLQYLCKKCPDKVFSESRTCLEEFCVRFLAKCSLCHNENQHGLAKVLCDVIAQQVNGISGFLRRLILQLLLENEKVPVSIEADETVYKNTASANSYLPLHPAFKQTHDRALLYLGTNTTLSDILEQYVSFSTGVKSDFCTSVKKEQQTRLDYLKSWWGMAVDMSVAAGVTAKDKRLKDAKNFRTSTPKKKTRYSSWASLTSIDTIDGRNIKCDTLDDNPLPLSLTIGQVLRMVEDRGTSSDWPCLHLKVCRNKNGEDDQKCLNAVPIEMQTTLSSTLQVFCSMGGLALLAQHLPTVYPETIRAPSAEKPMPETSDSDWVKVDGIEEIYEDIEDATAATMGGSGNSGNAGGRRACSAAPYVPPHSLTAFGLFLRLPGYADTLLWDTKKALCLLRLVFGVTDDGEGGDIFLNPVAETLPTLPFEVLRHLYATTPLTTDDGRLLRKISINLGVTHLLLSCLSVFTHQTQTGTYSGQPIGSSGCASATSVSDISKSSPTTSIPSSTTTTTGAVITSALASIPVSSRPDDKGGQLYWAKGTGFGTGSTQQSWNVEQALLKQRSEEEHVTVLLRVLSAYTGYAADSDVASTNTGGDDCADADEDDDDDDDDVSDNSLPANFAPLLANSALLPALSSYLRNDSVLDMARHIPLYRAALELLRAMAVNPQLVHLLLPRPDGNDPSISSLLTNMKTCVDTYASKLRSAKNQTTDKKKKVKVSLSAATAASGSRILKAKAKAEQEEAEWDEGLAMLMPFIRMTTTIVCDATYKITGLNQEESADNRLERPFTTTPEERYLSIMKKIQFDTFEMVQALPDGGYKFIISYHFESNARSAGESSHPTRVKRLAQEAVTLATSLPLSYSSSVFVRCDTDRLDTMKVLITGPADTPYANGCFELDVFFPPDYPTAPMMINLETTGHHSVRFNPNLYNDGKVCLSVLNTWHGRPEEKWNAQTSSFLQVLVSIQSLILVPEPYFNEPGYERSRGTPSGTQSSREYNATICQATARWAMLEQIVNPCPCFRDVINSHFYLKRTEIIEQVAGWIRDLEVDGADKRSNRIVCSASGVGGGGNTKRATYSNLDQFKKVYQSLKEKLTKLPPPKGVEPDNVATVAPVDEADGRVSTGGASSSMDVDNDRTVTNGCVDQNDIDADIDMEKMVKDMCG